MSKNFSTSKTSKIQSRDEMNLAEFPLSVLYERTPKETTLVFRDTIIENGQPRIREMKIIGSNEYGLPSAKDEDVIVALLLLTHQQAFNNQKIYFNQSDLVEKLGWPQNGQSFARLRESLLRWKFVGICTTGFWDNKAKAYKSYTQAFNIIDQVKLFDREEGSSEEPKNYFKWSDVLWESFKAGNLKYLDYDLWRSLKTHTARRLYRYLDKFFSKHASVKRKLKEFCHGWLGFSKKLRYRSKLVEKLTPAIEELKAIGFLEKVEFVGDYIIFYKGQGQREEKKDNGPQDQEAFLNRSNSDPVDRLVAELVKRSVDRQWASEYLRNINPDYLNKIESLIEYFDLIRRNDKTKVKSPGGYLRAMIEKDWSLPPDFQSSRQLKDKATEQKRASEQSVSEDQLEIQRQMELDKRRALAFDSLASDEQEERIKAKIAELKASELWAKMKRMPPDKLREHVIYQIQKDLLPC